MLITATTFTLILFFALALLALGHWQKNVLSYGLGCTFLIILGSFIFIQGFAEPVGAVTDYNISGNVTVGETVVTTYEQNTGWWTDFLGIALGLGGFGLAFMMVTEMQDQKRRRDESPELEGNF